MNEPIILIGGGGHCRSVMDVLEAEGKFYPAGIVDRRERIGQKILGVEIVAADDDLPGLVEEYPNFLITLGQIESAEPRKRLYTTLEKLGVCLPTVISPLARVSPHAQVGPGTVVMHFSLVNAGARVGENCILNSRCLVEHDATVEGHCHLSTASVLNGSAAMAEGGFLGSGAVVRNGVHIGAGAVIGMGARVLRDVNDHDTFL